MTRPVPSKQGPCKIHNPQTIADGLRTESLGSITFPAIQKNVDEMITVSDADILDTMYYLWTRMKIVVEPSGATALAPLFKDYCRLRENVSV